MKKIKSQICICGAGISGVFTALLLGKRGYDVIVIERLKKFNPNGADIIKPAVIKILKELDLYDEIVELGGIERNMVDMFHDGELLNRFKYEDNDIFLLFPCEKITALVVKKLEDYPNVKMFFDESIETVEMNEDCAILSNESLEVETEICIACDGNNSILRQKAGVQLNYLDIEQTILFGELDSCVGVEDVSKVYVNSNGGFTYLYPIGSNKSRIVIGFNNEQYVSLIENKPSSIITENIQKYVANDSHELISRINDSTHFVKVHPKLFKSDNYFFKRIIFVGNTVHSVHPLSGYGMNLAVEDAYEAAIQIDEFYNGEKEFEDCMLIYQEKRKRTADDFVDYSKRLFESTFDREHFMEVLNINKYKSAYEKA